MKPKRQTAKLTQSFNPKPAAAGGGRRGGGGGDREPPPVAKSASPPRNPGLTPTFNKAAKGSKKPPQTYKQQIATLKSMMSDPKPLLTLTPKYADSNKPQSKRDNLIHKKIGGILETVAAQRAKLKMSYNKAASTGVAKQSFNRAARRR